MMHGCGESDSAIVAAKPTNKAERSAAEPVERRAEAKGNAGQQSTGRTQSRGTVLQALERILHVASISRRAVNTRGGSRMPELGTYGSVRGARGNSRPYRDHWSALALNGLVANGPKRKYGQRDIVRSVGRSD
jgi:hypothetical protein